MVNILFLPINQLIHNPTMYQCIFTCINHIRLHFVHIPHSHCKYTQVRVIRPYNPLHEKIHTMCFNKDEAPTLFDNLGWPLDLNNVDHCLWNDKCDYVESHEINNLT